MDLFAPKGTPILPLFSGEIVGLGWNALGGRTITVVDPERQLVAYYAHLDNYDPDRHLQETVTLATRLGWVGTSGNAEQTPPHLHLQVRQITTLRDWRAGSPVNVAPVLEARWRCGREDKSTSGL